MRDLIYGDVSRCRGELAGDDWGHEDKICHVREHCKRFVQNLLDAGVKRQAPVTGWACATEEKENLILIEQQLELV